MNAERQDSLDVPTLTKYWGHPSKWLIVKSFGLETWGIFEPYAGRPKETCATGAEAFAAFAKGTR